MLANVLLIWHSGRDSPCVYLTFYLYNDKMRFLGVTVTVYISTSAVINTVKLICHFIVGSNRNNYSWELMMISCIRDGAWNLFITLHYVTLVFKTVEIFSQIPKLLIIVGRKIDGFNAINITIKFVISINWDISKSKGYVNSWQMRNMCIFPSIYLFIIYYYI